MWHSAVQESSVIVGTLLSSHGHTTPRRGEYIDMIKPGIVDPLKVVRTALVEPSGVASLLTEWTYVGACVSVVSIVSLVLVANELNVGGCSS
jgi:hypothetical protein